MKKILVVLLVSLGLQTQAQSAYCDSLDINMELTTDVTTPWSMVYYLNGNYYGQENLDSLGLGSYEWWIYSLTILPPCPTIYYGNDITVTLPTNIFDTFKLCTTLDHTFLDCTVCDTLVFQGDFWTFISSPSTPLSVEEFKTNPILDNKTYDLLGREITEVPVGTIYIQNNKKYITLK